MNAAICSKSVAKAGEIAVYCLRLKQGPWSSYLSQFRASVSLMNYKRLTRWSMETPQWSQKAHFLFRSIFGNISFNSCPEEMVLFCGLGSSSLHPSSGLDASHLVNHIHGPSIALFEAFSSSRSLEKVDVWYFISQKDTSLPKWAPVWTRLCADCRNLARWDHVHIVYWAEKQEVSAGRLSNLADGISWGILGDNISFKSDWVKDSPSVLKGKHSRLTLHWMPVNPFFLSNACCLAVVFGFVKR